jgi:hypothetical protein
MRSVVALVGVAVFLQSHVPPPLVVHEWGTITTRHGPDGTPEGRLNRIAAEDTLPSFVHRYEPAATGSDPRNALVKTVITPGRADVTMRLETPVLYFHPPVGWRATAPVTVSVRFRGGVLNEFYPNAEPQVSLDADRLNAKVAAGAVPRWDGVNLSNFVVGQLRWTGLTLRDSVSTPRTTSHVWLAPRHVRSAGVVSPGGESERYVFYRGVAHLDAVFQTRLTSSDVRLAAPARLLWLHTDSTTIPATWLVDVRPDGRVAFRAHGAITLARTAPGRELARLPLFSARDYAASHVTDLRHAVKRALTASGLFDDEAEAMLETWKESYFRTPGLRVLHLVPREWVAYFLPLEISVPHVATRVLVGRIDLVER